MKSKNKTCPLKKIVSFGAYLSDDGQRCDVILECGHRVIVSTRTTYRARCWKCRDEKGVNE